MGNSLILNHKYSFKGHDVSNLGKFNDYFNKFYEKKKSVDGKKQLTEEEKEINELILRFNKSNAKPEYLQSLREEDKKEPLSYLDKMRQKSEEKPKTPEEPIVELPTSFQEGSKDLVNSNRFNLAPIKLEVAKEGYKKTLKKLEKEIIDENKNYVL